MNNHKQQTDNLIDLNKLDRNFSLRGSFNPDRTANVNSGIFERLGFTTSINSIVSDLEKTGEIHIMSSFSQTQNQTISKMPTKFGAISDINLGQISLNPAVNRIKQINSLVLRILVVAMIINFLFIFFL